MAYKIGQRVCWIANDPTLSPMKKRIFGGHVTKLGRDTVYVDNKHAPEDQLYASFIFPETEETMQLLRDTLDQDMRHKREDDELLARTMQVINDCVRKGLK